MSRCRTAKDRVEHLQNAIRADLSRVRRYKTSGYRNKDQTLKANELRDRLHKMDRICQIWLDTYNIHRGQLSLLARLGYFDLYPCLSCPVTGNAEQDVTLEVCIVGA